MLDLHSHHKWHGTDGRHRTCSRPTVAAKRTRSVKRMSANISRRRLLKSSVAGAAAMSLAARAAHGQEVTLRAVSAWTKGTAFSAPFERYVERVNETGKGIIQLNYLGGGAKIMNVFDMGKSL